nr:MAG TPA: hypothetical protein [Caudoviricetes sp.]
MRDASASWTVDTTRYALCTGQRRRSGTSLRRR